MVVLSLLGSLFLGILLYLGITILVIGSTFVVREALLFFFGIDLYEVMRSWSSKLKLKPKKKKQEQQLTDSDEEWLKNRGRY